MSYDGKEKEEKQEKKEGREGREGREEKREENPAETQTKKKYGKHANEERKRSGYEAPTRDEVKWEWATRLAGIGFMLLHQILIVGITATILLCRRISVLILITGVLFFIHGLYVVNGNSCILTQMERKYKWNIDAQDCLGQMFYPGYDSRTRHRQVLGMMVILGGLYMCITKLVLTFLIDLVRSEKVKTLVVNALHVLCTKS